MTREEFRRRMLAAGVRADGTRVLIRFARIAARAQGGLHKSELIAAYAWLPRSAASLSYDHAAGRIVLTMRSGERITIPV